MSLAGSMAFSGDNAGAFQILEEASELAGGLLLAEIEFQRGTLLARIGERKASLACFSRAMPIFEQHHDLESIAMTLHNRAMVQISSGDPIAAEEDLLRARAIYAEDHSDADVAYADHALAIVASLRGDLPHALELLERSERRLTELLGSASEIQVSRCEVLLSAGLFREALQLAAEIATDLHKAGLAQDEAEARLVGAQAALLAGRLDVALSWANRASEMFSEQSRASWKATARLVGIQVQHDAGGEDPRLVAEARVVADILQSEGHVSGANRARLLAGMIGFRFGMQDAVLPDLKMVAHRRRGPIETQLQSQLALATTRVIEGNRRGADAAARAGMRILDEYQAALGATDVRLGVERHGRELGNMGLSLALESRNPRRVWRWMELRRGRALTRRPVTPPDDDELAHDLATLRQVTAELRTAGGEGTVGLRRRQRRLQESIRDRARLMRGQAMAADRVDPGALIGSLRDRTIVEMALLDGRMVAVVVSGGRFRLQELGTEEHVSTETAGLRFAMRRLARGRGSVATAQEAARRLDRMLFARLRLGEGPLVVVPTPGLYAVPWWALPTCQRRSVTISPSAELWYRAQLSGAEGAGAVVAAGPDLAMADVEVRAVARLYPGAGVISSHKATVESVRSRLDGAGTAHVACHSSFQFENPMFSALHLADGDLSVYDIERLTNAPTVVVLSACDSGFTETHPGEELMGLSSALLSMGTRSIVASVGLVPDSGATKDLMVALHRGLVAGESISDALHAAQSDLGHTPDGYKAASSFICIGAG
ncbi:MAG: CHAT domain-containing protein, partial [Acidimicrobiia bacterium]